MRGRVASWDNLTGKGLIRVVPDRVLVWNNVQAEEAVAMHGIPRDRVVATGAPKFDEWFERRPSSSREELARVGLAPGPYVLYACSSAFIAPDEVPFVARWLAAVRAPSPALGEVGVLVRPHPQNAPSGTASTSRGSGTSPSGRRAARSPTRATRAPGSSTRSATALRSSGSTRAR